MASTPSPKKLAEDDAKGRWRLLQDTFRLEEALEQLSIDVVREQRNGELLCRCPLPSHGGPDNNPSFILSTGKLVYHCRGCGEGGTMPKLIMELHGCSFIEAVDWLCQFTEQRSPRGIAFANRIRSILARPRHEKIPPKHPLLPWMPLSLLERFDQPTDYYASRGISEDACRALRLGFHPDHTRTSKYYTGPAAIIPHIFKGELVGWQERWLDWAPGWDGYPKYTNTDDFPKQETLYNYDQVADNPNAVVVVESAMTVAKLLTAGIPAVATFGGSVTPQQLRLLKRFRQGLILAFDNDTAGAAATRTVGDATYRHVPIVVLPPPPGEKADLGDLTVEEIHAKIPDTRPFILWRSGL